MDPRTIDGLACARISWLILQVVGDAIWRVTVTRHRVTATVIV